jgi:hypothetical protein
MSSMAAMTSVVFAKRWIGPGRSYAEMTSSGTMRVDVIGTGLRIILEHEYDRIAPDPDFDSASTIRPRARYAPPRL